MLQGRVCIPEGCYVYSNAHHYISLRTERNVFPETVAINIVLLRSTERTRLVSVWVTGSS